MGDFYSIVVPQKVNSTEAAAIAEKVVQYLINRKIISADKTDCTLGEEDGYPPAENYRQVMEHPTEDLFGLLTNGLEVNVGREVFYGDGVDNIKCPACEAGMMDADWGEAIDEWMNDTGNDTICCSACGKESSVTELVFEPAWAFGELGFRFWNWGAPFKEAFINDIEMLTGYRVKTVYGKL